MNSRYWDSTNIFNLKLNHMKKLYLLAAGALLIGTQAIAQGIDVEKAVPLFDINFQETYGVEAIGDMHPSLAQCGDKIVIDFGTGATPIYVNPATGAKEGEINMGAASATGAVFSDDKGVMLICNYCPASEELVVYKATSVTEAPVEFFKWTNSTSLPIGYQMHVAGDLSGKAAIIASCDGVPDVTGSHSIIRWEVTDGAVGEAEVISFDGLGNLYWINDSNGNQGHVAAKSANKEDGYFVGFYGAGDGGFNYISGDGTNKTASVGVRDWKYTYATCDSRVLNGVSYTAAMEISFWPQWGAPGCLKLFNTSASDGQALATVADDIEMADFLTGDGPGNAVRGAVLIASTDGMMGLYYISDMYLNFGGKMYPADASGISEIETGNAPVEFFNLQGIRVENPENGLFIRRQGEKSTKIFVKLTEKFNFLRISPDNCSSSG